ncbi:cation efflux protein [Auriculariales sp. MPI-PUGE-AT-0066]|nr:cation efflux protein [Auriculariales sp. MPI-PUGE-AT-0066]
MAVSRSTRIIILLVIDVVFFFVELIAGYAVGSLALVADSFHMLNDVISLIVALYAIKLSQNAANDEYSYGWHRAEILGALVNGVFLVALCCSIILEALQRFVTPSDISSPQVIMIVGSLGLCSNLVGLLLFHEHGHGHDHDHSHSHDTSSTPSIVAENEEVVTSPQEIERQPLLLNGANSHSHSRSSKKSPAHRARSPSASSIIYVHPAQTRAQIVQVANDISSSTARSPPVHRRSRLSMDKEISSSLAPTRGGGDVSIDMAADPFSEPSSSPVRTTTPSHSHSHDHPHHSHSPEASRRSLPPALPEIRTPSPTHSHDHAHSHGGHGHSHGSMNMRALLLHVMGDALGNVGVIATGLVILLVKADWALYFDPGISLLISIIIFSSAWPLVKSTSIILLQGVPSHVSLNDVRAAMTAVDGVRSVHELHVWQLSENKVIASVHVQIERVGDYMYIAAEVRRVLHEHGIHSATIQPEYFSQDGDSGDAPGCLLPCPPNNVCDDSNICCPPGPAATV